MKITRFTLIEVLVVVAIIAILASMLVAKGAISTNNLPLANAPAFAYNLLA